MQKRLLLAVLALVALLGILALFERGERQETVDAAGLPGAAREPQSAPESAELLSPDRLTVPAGAAGGGREAEASATPVRPDPWAGELAGLRGRLVEMDGTPVANLRVALLEADGTTLLGGDWERLGEPAAELVLDEVRTDEEGGFRFHGARAGAFHGLGIDLGGARGTLRILEQALVNGADTDLGDIVLAAYGVFLGRVVDETGDPVRGARVRVAPLPPEALQVNLYDLRRETRIAVRGEQVIEFPERFRSLLDVLPVPTAFTDQEGRFRLEGVPLETVLGGIDKPGWLGTAIEPIEAVGGEQDLGDLVLRRGRTPRGTVVDAGGRPVPGAEVCVGAFGQEGVALLQPAGRTDAAGRFQGVGVPLEGPLVSAARRSSRDPWTLAIAMEGEPRVELATAVPLTVHVRAPGGEPLGGARIEVQPAPGQRGLVAQILAGVVGHAVARNAPSRETEPGTHRLDALTVGSYDVTATVAGFAPTTERVEVVEPAAELTLTLRAGRSIAVRVLDAVSREPVGHARVALVRYEDSFPKTVALAWTDAAGEATLGPFDPSAGSEPRARGVLVQQPRYPSTLVPLEGDPPSLLVELASGGVVEGRIHWGAAPPERRYMVMIVAHMGFLQGFFSAPRMALSDADGAFRVDGFAAAEYELTVYERYFDADPVALLREEREPQRVFETAFELASGEVRRLDVDLTAGGRGPVAPVFGEVLQEGRPLGGAEVYLDSADEVRTQTDAFGRFDLGDVSAVGGHWLTIHAPVSLPDGRVKMLNVYGDFFELEPNVARRIELDLSIREIPVEVVDRATQTPVEGAEVKLVPHQEGVGWNHEAVETDSLGRASALTFAQGPATLSVQASGYIDADQTLQLPREDPLAPVRVELGVARPCRGRIVLRRKPGGEQAWSILRVQALDGGRITSTQVDRGTLEFSLEGLTAGRYRADLWIDGTHGEPVEFQLGPEGALDLELEFVPASDE